ncbi:hypothetical protein M3P21_20865 [Ruegeria sp. 2012CJ41-6]|uniref:Propanediol utilization protein n=1 Tax=Ruegeria spongiae TaxID=2942209 RepID=A0ABT0Q8S4_9RHOB|nr:hypothetical protein [Ruegeria spongiae]MCL6285972.1 hypothetical protein [Ruegeria spongiae]
MDRLGDGALVLDQDPEVLTSDRAARFLERIGAVPGRFRLRAEMPPGGGAGASTAALLALAEAAGIDRSGLAPACLDIERASDPLMFPQPDRLLWASRRGEAVAEVAPLPGCEVVGGFWGAPVRTVANDLDFPDIADLAEELADGVGLDALARIAATSANRCTALRGPATDPTPALAGDLGALGHLRAHTGSARGLIFKPGHVPADAERALAEAGMTRILRFSTGGTA